MHQAKIEFYKIRDFGAKINALIEFVRENLRKLFLTLFFIGGPAALLIGFLMKGMLSSMLEASVSAQTSQDIFGIYSSLGGAYFLMMLTSFFVSTLVTSVVYHSVKLYNSGEYKEASITDILKLSLRKVPGLAGLYFLIVVIVIVGFVFLVLPGIFLGVVLSISAAIYVFEDVSVWGAISRSFRLIKGKWWSTFGLLIVTVIISYFVQSIFSIPWMISYFVNMFMLLEETRTGGGMQDPSGIMGLFTSGYMSILIALSMIGGYISSSIPLIGLGYQYSNLVERTEGKGLMEEIESFDEED